MHRNRVVVVGAGAAGLVAAAEAASRGAEVVLLEKSSKTGVKILMSGGTRCNLTHNTDARGITKQFGHAQRFLQPSVGAFPPAALVSMFNQAGLPTKIEETGKIFPQSDRALHVRDLLHRQVVDAGATVHRSTAVTDISRSNGLWRIETTDGPIEADRVVVTVGGKSYPGCGTTGDGYAWLEKLGHTIIPPRPALVPLVGGTDWTHTLSGLTLDDVVVTVKRPQTKKPLTTRRGSWLFTHFGFSGPAAMDVSGAMTAEESFTDLRLTVDLLPELTYEDIRQRLGQRDHDGGRRRVSGVVGDWLPSRLAQALVQQTGCDHSLAQLPRAGATKLLGQLKRLPLPISGTRGFAKAEVTAGGVALNEVDPRTLESRICDGLFIAGEVLDVDGPIGGYNFQAAFSTGRAAGIAAASNSAQQ
jgi:predicted Rossmann fold flavoprotein